MLLGTHISTVVRASGADDDCAALYDEGCNGVLTAAWHCLAIHYKTKIGLLDCGAVHCTFNTLKFWKGCAVYGVTQLPGGKMIESRILFILLLTLSLEVCKKGVNFEREVGSCTYSKKEIGKGRPCDGNISQAGL